MKRWLLWTPLAAFAVVALIVAVALRQEPDRTIRSRLVGAPLPAFALPPAVAGKPGLSDANFRRGQPRLLNVFASWCLPCVAESPQLLALRRAGVAIDGVAIRDRAEDVRRFLDANGDPYNAIGSDPESRLQLALGSSGVPETFVVDGRGIIRHQHVGDLRSEDVAELLRQVEAAR